MWGQCPAVLEVYNLEILEALTLVKNTINMEPRAINTKSESNFLIHDGT